MMKFRALHSYRIHLPLWLSILGALPLISSASPRLPVIPNRSFNITNYGAAGNGVATNTTAIQSAITAASNAGGGVVEVPAGIYLSGPISLKNNVALQLDADAILRMLPLSQYPGGDVSPAHFISGSSLHDVEIRGSGAIDGQGEPWWRDLEANKSISRPNLVNLSSCSAVLIRDVTFSNSPSQNLVLKGRGGNITVSNVTISAPSSTDPVNPSHNTDAIDLAQTNALIADCNIHVGDDNIAIGSSGSLSRDILVTNCLFGVGHGVSIGSHTAGGVSNLTVINCSFNGTDNGIRLKSERDRGGLVQNLNYLNLTMTNVDWPFLIYSDYEFGLGTITKVTPSFVVTNTAQPVTGTTPIWRNITFSNIVASASSGSSRPPLMIWGLPEMAVSNVVFQRVNLISNSPRSPGIYNAHDIRFIDSQVIVPSSIPSFLLYNAGLTITNQTAARNPVRLDGLTTNSIGNALAFYNSDAVLENTNALGDGPLTLGGSIFTVKESFALSPATVLNLAPGTNDTRIAISGNLKLGGTVNVLDGGGLTNGTYTVLTYSGALNGVVPNLGSTPAGFRFSFDTNTVGEVKLKLAPPVNSNPTNLHASVMGNTLELSWPVDHIGWLLEVQTNTLTHGLGTNWVIVPDSEITNRFSLPLASFGYCAFLRLIYP